MGLGLDDLIPGGICVGIQVWQLQTDREGEMLSETDRSDIFKSLDDEKLDTFAFSQALSVTVMVIMTRGLTQKFVIR